jgi:hypothetical protein
VIGQDVELPQLLLYLAMYRDGPPKKTGGQGGGEVEVEETTTNEDVKEDERSKQKQNGYELTLA